ncbi:MAG: hypothetical protein AABX94_00865, partial [Nanoarchaeota archaeon]
MVIVILQIVEGVGGKNTLYCSIETKPFEYSSVDCLNCGFSYVNVLAETTTFTGCPIINLKPRAHPLPS